MIDVNSMLTFLMMVKQIKRQSYDILKNCVVKLGFHYKARMCMFPTGQRNNCSVISLDIQHPHLS